MLCGKCGNQASGRRRAFRASRIRGRDGKTQRWPRKSSAVTCEDSRPYSNDTATAQPCTATLDKVVFIRAFPLISGTKRGSQNFAVLLKKLPIWWWHMAALSPESTAMANH